MTPSGSSARVPPSPVAHANYNWHLANRNKRGVVVNLKSPGGTRILRRLVEWADVVITNFPHGVREGLHLGYDEVSSWNPRVVYADLTGFGDAGPDAELPGFDVTAFWSRSGLLASMRDAGAPPTVPVYGSGDYATAIGIYAAIVTALYRRERTGMGANVGTSLLAEGVWSAGTLVAGALAGGRSYGLHDRTAPYEPADQPVSVLTTAGGSCSSPRPPHWPGLARDRRASRAARRTRASPTSQGIGEELRGVDRAARRRVSLAAARALEGGSSTGNASPTGSSRHRRRPAADPQLRANDIVVPLDGVERAGGDRQQPDHRPRAVEGAGDARAGARRAQRRGARPSSGSAATRSSSFGAEGAIPGAPRTGGSPMMTTEATDVVLHERRDDVLIITLNRPAQKNAVNYEVATQLAAAIDLLDADPEISVGVLTGAGGTFSAGMDLKAFARGQAPILPGRGFGGLTRATVRKPLIAAVEGWALGGGFEMVLACDLIVAAERRAVRVSRGQVGARRRWRGAWSGCRTASRTTSPPSSC